MEWMLEDSDLQLDFISKTNKVYGRYYRDSSLVGICLACDNKNIILILQVWLVRIKDGLWLESRSYANVSRPWLSTDVAIRYHLNEAVKRVDASGCGGGDGKEGEQVVEDRKHNKHVGMNFLCPPSPNYRCTTLAPSLWQDYRGLLYSVQTYLRRAKAGPGRTV